MEAKLIKFFIFIENLLSFDINTNIIELLDYGGYLQGAHIPDCHVYDIIKQIKKKMR